MAFAYGESEKESAPIVFYARTSSPKQLPALIRQTDRLRNYCKDNYAGRRLIEITDNASGGNVERKGFLALIRMILSGELDGGIIVAEHRDRIGRMNLCLFDLLCSEKSITTIYVEQDPEKTDTQLLQDEIMSILFLYSIKNYSRRGSDKRRKQPGQDAIEFGQRKLNAGLSLIQVEGALAKNGFTNEDGSAITRHAVRKYMGLQGHIEMVSPKTEQNSIEKFAARFIKRPQNYRVLVADAYAAYLKFCEKNHLLVLSKNRFANNLCRHTSNIWLERDGKQFNHRAYAGIEIPGCEPHMVREYKPKNETSTDACLRFLDKHRLWKGKRTEFYRIYAEWATTERTTLIGRAKFTTIIKQMGGRVYLEKGIYLIQL